jgi:hypothetical protein
MIKKRMITDRSGKYQFWTIIRRVRSDYLRSLGDIRAESPMLIEKGFYDYMKKVYGIELHIIDGYIGPDYDIVDEKKYMLYQIKYT